MPRVNQRKKNKAGAERKCGRCGKTIQPGDLYYTWSFRYGGARFWIEIAGLPVAYGSFALDTAAALVWFDARDSAQRPTNAPVFVISLTWKMLSEWLATGSGITSRLNSISGTQNEWMTSRPCSTNRTLLFVGSTRTGTYVLVPTV